MASCNEKNKLFHAEDSIICSDDFRNKNTDSNTLNVSIDDLSNDIFDFLSSNSKSSNNGFG